MPTDTLADFRRDLAAKNTTSALADVKQAVKQGDLSAGDAERISALVTGGDTDSDDVLARVFGAGDLSTMNGSGTPAIRDALAPINPSLTDDDLSALMGLGSIGGDPAIVPTTSANANRHAIHRAAKKVKVLRDLC
jgi:hypothetical protein